MFKLGDYFTRFYSSIGNRSKYGSIWQVTHVISRKDMANKITLKKYHIHPNFTEISIHSESFLLGGYSSGVIRKSTSNEIFCYISSVIHENRI